MAAISDAVVIGIVLGLVFAAVCYYLYTIVSQLERKVSLMENILLDLKVTTEQTLLSSTDYMPSLQQQHQEEDTFDREESYQMSMEHVTLSSQDEQTLDQDYLDKDSREVQLDQVSTRSKESTKQVKVERDSEKFSVSMNYEAMTYKELVALAKQHSVSGIRNLSKAQLIEAIRRHVGSGGSNVQQETKQMELSNWATSTISFTDSKVPEQESNELSTELQSAQEDDQQGSLLSPTEFEQLTSFVS
jgi:hypothetical protein